MLFYLSLGDKAMTEAGSAEILEHAVLTATSLRAIQVDFADQDPVKREGVIEDEIERALSQIVPSQRREFLEALGKHFPAFQSAPTPAPAPIASVTPITDWRVLVQQMTKLAKGISGDEQRQLSAALIKSGLVREASGKIPEETARPLRERVGLADDITLDPTRVLQLAEILVDFATRTDELTWTFWSRLAANSRIRPNGTLVSEIRRFLSNDQESSRRQVKEELGKLYRMFAAIIFATQGVGFRVNNWLQQRFMPNSILELAKKTKGTFENVHMKAWNLFSRLVEDTTANVVDAEVREGIKNEVEDTMSQGGIVTNE
jgi:hypothetical protein